MTGERYKMVPDEFKKLARGEFGRTPQPVNPEVLEKCGIKEEDLVTCRPADLLEPGMDKFKAELAAKGFPNASEGISLVNRIRNVLCSIFLRLQKLLHDLSAYLQKLRIGSSSRERQLNRSNLSHDTRVLTHD